MTHCVRINTDTNEVVEDIICPGLRWCKKHREGTWLEIENDMSTGKGYIYYPEHNKFVFPIAFKSWTLDENLEWQPPIPRPDDYTSDKYKWIEESQEWVIKNSYVAPSE